MWVVATLRGYVALGSARLRAMLQYRAVALAALATQVFWGLLRLMILDGFYSSAPEASDFSNVHFVSYVWLGQALFGLFPLSVDPVAAERIRSGTVAYELLRPLDLYANWAISAIGWRIGRTLFRATPLVLFAMVLLPLFGRPEWALGRKSTYRRVVLPDPLTSDAHQHPFHRTAYRAPYSQSMGLFFGLHIPCFVLVRLKNGSLLGGAMDARSFASSYPSAEDMYLEQLWKITKKGQFLAPLPATKGALISRSECEYIQFVELMHREAEYGKDHESSGARKREAGISTSG